MCPLWTNLGFELGWTGLGLGVWGVWGIRVWGQGLTIKNELSKIWNYKAYE